MATPAEVVTGEFEPYVVGSAGRAAGLVRPAFVPDHPDRPDTIVDGIVVNGPAGAPAATVRAASVRGLSHRAYATVRQDDYALRVTPDGRYLVLCVADGVSAAPLSHLAACWAAQEGTNQLVRLLASTPPADLEWTEFIGYVATVIVDWASRTIAELDADPVAVARTMAAALSFAVVDLAPTGAGNAVHLMTIGDTSGWIIGQDGYWFPLQPVKNAGADIYSSAVSALPALTQPPAPPVTAVLGPGEVLVVMTDGVGDPLGDGSGVVGEFLARAWREPPPELAFAAQISFTRRTFDDDRTAVAVWPVAPAS